MVAAAALLVLGLAILGCGESSPDPGEPGSASAELASAHVHALAVDPGSDALMIATHGGLFELGDGLRRAGRTRDDLMGFDVTGPSDYIASGHPGAGSAANSPHLGLIRSEDAGESWESVSLSGEADFHSLAALGRRIYGYNSLAGALLRSDDRGRSWTPTDQVGAVVDLAVDPSDPDRLIASTDEGLFLSEDGGDAWESFRGPPGLVAWTSSGIFAFDAFGKVLRAEEDVLEPVGRLTHPPVAVTGLDDQLYVASADSQIFGSTDGGESWEQTPLG